MAEAKNAETTARERGDRSATGGIESTYSTARDKESGIAERVPDGPIRRAKNNLDDTSQGVAENTVVAKIEALRACYLTREMSIGTKGGS